MSDQSSLNGAPPKRLKQDQVLFLILFIILAILSLVYVYTSSKNSPGNEISLAQALTLVAGASQTAEAANPGFSASQAARESSIPSNRVIRTPLPDSSSANSTPAATTGSSHISPTKTRSSAGSSPTRSNSTGQNTSAEEPTFPVSNVTVRPTYTPRPTETLRPKDPPTATRTSTATPSPGLPGLSMSSVVNKLKNEKGFACTQAGTTPGPILWMCDVQIGNDVWYHVDIYGTLGIEVTNLFISVFQTDPDDAKAIDIIGYVASLPYKGSNPTEARQWVAQTLPDIQSVDDVQEKIIGNVRFKLYGSPQGRYLEMGEPVQQ